MQGLGYIAGTEPGALTATKQLDNPSTAAQHRPPDTENPPLPPAAVLDQSQRADNPGPLASSVLSPHRSRELIRRYPAFQSGALACAIPRLFFPRNLTARPKQQVPKTRGRVTASAPLPCAPYPRSYLLAPHLALYPRRTSIGASCRRPTTRHLPLLLVSVLLAHHVGLPPRQPRAARLAVRPRHVLGPCTTQSRPHGSQHSPRRQHGPGASQVPPHRLQARKDPEDDAGALAGQEGRRLDPPPRYRRTGPPPLPHVRLRLDQLGRHGRYAPAWTWNNGHRGMASRQPVPQRRHQLRKRQQVLPPLLAQAGRVLRHGRLRLVRCGRRSEQACTAPAQPHPGDPHDPHPIGALRRRGLGRFPQRPPHARRGDAHRHRRLPRALRSRARAQGEGGGRGRWSAAVPWP